MTRVKIVANKTENFEEGRQLFSKLSTVVSRYLKLPMTFVGVIPNDNQLVKAVMQQSPVSKGARQNNLKNIDLEIPRDRLIVFTGLSGSGKSSLAFDDLAKTLLSDSEEMITSRHGMAGFFANMVRGKRFT